MEHSSVTSGQRELAMDSWSFLLELRLAAANCLLRLLVVAFRSSIPRPARSSFVSQKAVVMDNCMVQIICCWSNLNCMFLKRGITAFQFIAHPMVSLFEQLAAQAKQTDNSKF